MRNLVGVWASGLVLLSVAGCSRPSEAETEAAAPSSTSPTPPRTTATQQAAQARWPEFYRAVIDATAQCDEAYADFIAVRSKGRYRTLEPAKRVAAVCDAAQDKIADIARPKVPNEHLGTALDMWAYKVGSLAFDRARIADGFSRTDPDREASSERLIAEEAANAAQRDAFLVDAVTMADGGPSPWAS